MKYYSTGLACLLICSLASTAVLARHTPKLTPTKITADQTDTLSTVQPVGSLPFRIVIERANFQLPVGFHSGVVGVYKGLWVFIAGRINGLHGFGLTNNFPPDKQNYSIYVVNPATGQVWSRSLYDSTSGLTQQQIDTLAVTSPQSYQESDTLIMTGGYGVDTPTRTFNTKAVLTAIYLPGIVNWVTGVRGSSVAANIRQTWNAQFQITGGHMAKLGNTTQLVFGQNFVGEYTPFSNGNYSNQVRQFQIKNGGGPLSVTFLNPMPRIPDPNFRRRDLNVFPTMLNKSGTLQQALVAYAGVFTISGGVWTVPVVIDGINNPIMANPDAPSTFKQAMNQYVCAKASLYSRKFASNYHIFFGGLSLGFF